MESESGDLPLDTLCQQISSLIQAVQGLQEGYHRLEQRVESVVPGASPQPVAASASSASTASAPTATVVLPPLKQRVPAPERFSGDRSKFRALKNACWLYFLLQPCTFSLESTKVGFLVSLPQG